MSWDRIFWLLFALSEFLIMLLMYADFSFEYALAAMLIFILAVPKLAEDRKKLRMVKGTLKVRKTILNKLKANK